MPKSFACIGLSKDLPTNGKDREASRVLACLNTNRQMEKKESFACICWSKYLQTNGKGREVSRVLACSNTYRQMRKIEKLHVYGLVQILTDKWKRLMSFACIGLFIYLQTNGKG